jgi:hypothetical protein
MIVNVRDHGAKGDGVADDTAAFVAAFDAVKAMRVYIATQRPLDGGGTVDVPGGSYRVQADKLRGVFSRVRWRGEGPSASCLRFFGAGSGFRVESEFKQKHGGMAWDGLAINRDEPAVSTDPGDVGILYEGGGDSEVRDCQIGGWHTALRWVGTNLCYADRCVFSSWNGPGQVGVHFAVSPVGGGATNCNAVTRSQFNGCADAILCDDGANNLVEACNVNSPEVMCRVRGTQGLTLRNVECEGVRGRGYLVLGRDDPAGENIGAVSVEGGWWSCNEPHKAAPVWCEPGAIVRYLAVGRGLTIAGLYGGISAPWADRVFLLMGPGPTLNVSRLDRRGLRVGLGEVAADQVWQWRPYGGPLVDAGV